MPNISYDEPRDLFSKCVISSLHASGYPSEAFVLACGYRNISASIERLEADECL